MSEKKLVAGIDIGGSKINIVLWDGKRVVDSWVTNEVSADSLKKGVSRFNVSKIGIGAAAILDYKTGAILSSPNLKKIEGLCLKKLLNKNIRFDNDVHCFLRAESKLGAAKGHKNVLAVAIGTGIGGAIKMDKEAIYSGLHGSAGEFGFMVIENGKSWEKLYQETKGNPERQKEIHSLGFANLINIFDPEIIVLGGGGSLLPDKKIMEKFILSPLSKKTKIIFGKLGPNAVAIGAALLWDIKSKNKK